MASPTNPPKSTQSKDENKERQGKSEFTRPISSPENPKIEESKPKKDRRVNWFYPEAPENKYDDMNNEKSGDLDADKDADVDGKENDDVGLGAYKDADVDDKENDDVGVDGYKGDDGEMTPPPSPLRHLDAPRTPHLNRRIKSNFVTPGNTPFSYNPLHVAPTPTPYKTPAASAETEHIKSA